MNRDQGPMRWSVLARLISLTPIPVRRLVRRVGLARFFGQFLTKSEAEMIFQRFAVGLFKKNQGEALEYWKRHRLLDEFKRVVHFKKDTKVLDVGCGVITGLHFVKGERYGIDPLAEEYKRIYKYPPGISVQKGVAEDLPFPDGFFDVVFCTNVLDHVERPVKVLKEIDRALKRDGSCLFSVYFFEGKKTTRDPDHTYTFGRQEILSLIRKEFRVVARKETQGIDSPSYILDQKSKNNELVLILKKK